MRPDGTTYASGTEFEFEDAIGRYRVEGRPHILTYLKTAAIMSAGHLASLEDAAAQKRALERFVTRWFRNESDGTLKAAFHNFATPADFEDLLEAHLMQLAESFVPPGVARRTSAPTWLGRSPFRGLQAFEPEHAPVFFGRTAATASVLAKLRVQGQAGRAFVLIVSMSGGGKSSLVRAGVLPLLLQPGIVGTATAWRRAVMRPSDGQGRPLDALEAALLDATADADADAMTVADRSDVEADQHANAAAAERFARRIVDRLRRIDARDVATTPGSSSDAAPACHIALVVDQLEEIFSDERVGVAERDAFFAALDALARSGVVWVLATMRSDAYARIADAPVLVALKEGDGQFDLLPPSVREIGQIIRLPAAAAGLRFEARPNTAEKLDDVIRDDAARNPGALPLLQFLLEELYQRRNADDVLTFHAYEELGGVEGALVQRAETVLANVGDAARDALPKVLRELVTFGIDDESRALRRVAPRDAFADPASNELVEALLDARLLVAGSSADGTPVVSLAHEALLQFWPRVKTWVDEDRELLMVHARLEAATREWERHGRRSDLLLPRGKPLAEARELTGSGVRLRDDERALLDASMRRARRFAMLRASAVAALALLTVAAGVAAWRAKIESSRAQVQATTAQRTTDFMIGLFAEADPDQSKGDKITVREVLDRGVEQIDAELSGERAVKANLLRAMGQAYTGLGLFDKGRLVLGNAVTESTGAAQPDALMSARLALADNRYQAGQYAEAESLYRAALAQATRADGRAGDVVTTAEAGLAETLAILNRPDEAERLFRDAMARDLKDHGTESLAYARDLDGLGRSMFTEARTDEAIPLLEQSLAIRRRLLGSNDGRVAISLNNLGTLFYQAGRLEDAASTYAEALPTYRHVFGPDHPNVASVLNNLGRVELMSDRIGPARGHLVDALVILRKSMDDSNDQLVLPLNSLAMAQIESGELGAARASLEEALRIARERRYWALNQVVGNLAALDEREGDCARARRDLVEADRLLALQYEAKLQTTERWRTAVLDLTRAACAARDDPAQAARLLSESLPLLDAHFGRSNLYDIQASRINAKIAGETRVAPRPITAAR